MKKQVAARKTVKTATVKASRPRVTEWTLGVVAERAMEAHRLECKAAHAYADAIDRANLYKTRNGIERIDLKCPKFQRFTRKQWGAYLEARDEAKKARARLKTACRNAARNGLWH
jgi:hypothetical protein